jgi:hypothetical protein
MTLVSVFILMGRAVRMFDTDSFVAFSDHTVCDEVLNDAWISQR